MIPNLFLLEENGGAIHTQEKCKTIKESKPRQEIL
jgi:hypothetical protein